MKPEVTYLCGCGTVNLYRLRTHCRKCGKPIPRQPAEDD